MEKFHDFIKRVFDEQYEACFGPDMLEKLELQDYYLTREEDGQLIALLHAQQVLENIHVKALVVDKEHQKKGLGASLLAELEEKATEAGVTALPCPLNLIRPGIFTSSKTMKSMPVYQMSHKRALPNIILSSD